jgi:hypothetical protein
MNVMTTNSRCAEVPGCVASSDAPDFAEAYQRFIGGNRTKGLAWFIPCGCCDGSGEHKVTYQKGMWEMAPGNNRGPSHLFRVV